MFVSSDSSSQRCHSDLVETENLGEANRLRGQAGAGGPVAGTNGAQQLLQERDARGRLLRSKQLTHIGKFWQFQQSVRNGYLAEAPEYTFPFYLVHRSYQVSINN